MSKKRIVVRILLFIAEYLNPDDKHAKALHDLATHINVGWWGKEEDNDNL